MTSFDTDLKTGREARVPLIVWVVMFWLMVAVGRLQEFIYLFFPGISIVGFGVAAMCLTAVAFLLSDARTRKTFMVPFATLDGKLMTVFLGLMALSGAVGMYPRLSLEFLKNFWPVALFYFAFRMVFTSIERIRKAIWGIVLSAGTLGFANTLNLGGPTSTGRLSIGGTYDPNDLGLMLVMSLPFVLFYFALHKGWRKAVAAGCLLVSLSGLALTQSRGAFLGLIVVSILMVWRDVGFSGTRKKIIVIAIAGTLFYAAMPAQYLERIANATDEEDTGMGRFHQWQKSMVLVAEDPFLGSGVCTYTVAYGTAIEDGRIPVDETSWSPYAWRPAHSSYVKVAVEMGLTGFLLYVALIVVSIFGLRGINTESRVHPWGTKDKLHIYAIVTEISFWGYLTSAAFLSQSYSPMFFMLIGLSGAIRSVALKRKTEHLQRSELPEATADR